MAELGDLRSSDLFTVVTIEKCRVLQPCGLNLLMVLLFHILENWVSVSAWKLA
jgi:hypothetical protein